MVITNLIESYDRLMAFGKKHLNDTFHLEGIQSVSARDHILREIISNLLMHRDFASGYVAKLVIEKNRIYTENANLSHGYGALDIATFEPFQKNPPISKVFREIGLADELGSGMRNTYKYTKMYSGGEPQFVEGDIFRITIPLSEVATVTVGPDSILTSGGDINGDIKLSETDKKVLAVIKGNPHMKRPDMVLSLNIGKSTLDRSLKNLKDAGFLKRVGSNKTGYWKVLE